MEGIGDEGLKTREGELHFGRYWCGTQAILLSISDDTREILGPVSALEVCRSSLSQLLESQGLWR